MQPRRPAGLAFLAPAGDDGWLLHGPETAEVIRIATTAALRAAVTEVERQDSPRWVWSDTAVIYPTLLEGDVRVSRCHDVGLSEALLAAYDGRPPKPELTAHPRQAPAQPALFPDIPLEGSPDPLAVLAAAVRDQERQVAQARLESPGLPLLVAAESAAALAAAEMSHVGLPWRCDIHDELLTRLLGSRPSYGGRPPRLQELAEQVAAALGVPRLNPDSQPEVLRAFRNIGIQLTSLRARELRGVDHPSVEPLLRYKELARLHSAHGWAWQAQWVRDGRFHPEYMPGGVVSGRWATRGGGALQIPRPVRAAVVADPGWVLVIADAGQLEPRILAALSGDPGMVEATRSGDLYASVAAQALGRSQARDEAKIALLSAMYGGGVGSPALAALRRHFPAALALLEDAARTGEDGGMVRSALGRTCPPPHADWQQAPEEIGLARARARGRFTRNFVIQASAADWANVLVATLRRRLERPAELVFFQHDEVIVHAPADLAEAVVAAVAAGAAEATRLVVGERGVHIPMQAVVANSYAEKA